MKSSPKITSPSDTCFEKLSINFIKEALSLNFSFFANLKHNETLKYIHIDAMFFTEYGLNLNIFIFMVFKVTFFPPFQFLIHLKIAIYTIRYTYDWTSVVVFHVKLNQAFNFDLKSKFYLIFRL